MYTRTKSLKSFSNKTEDIYEGIKFLFMNEWKNSNEKLKLRLIGKFFNIKLFKFVMYELKVYEHVT